MWGRHHCVIDAVVGRNRLQVVIRSRLGVHVLHAVPVLIRLFQATGCVYAAFGDLWTVRGGFASEGLEVAGVEVLCAPRA